LTTLISVVARVILLEGVQRTFRIHSVTRPANIAPRKFIDPYFPEPFRGSLGQALDS